MSTQDNNPKVVDFSQRTAVPGERPDRAEQREVFPSFYGEHSPILRVRVLSQNGWQHRPAGLDGLDPPLHEDRPPTHEDEAEGG